LVLPAFIIRVSRVVGLIVSLVIGLLVFLLAFLFLLIRGRLLYRSTVFLVITLLLGCLIRGSSRGRVALLHFTGIGICYRSSLCSKGCRLTSKFCVISCHALFLYC